MTPAQHSSHCSSACVVAVATHCLGACEVSVRSAWALFLMETTINKGGEGV